MKQSNQEIEVNHNAKDLYSIVLDIEKYPEYIPWCKNIDIIYQKKNKITANMIVDYKLFPTQKFTSSVFYDEKNMMIKTIYIEGPLKDLNTTWKFLDLKKNKSKVIFSVNFDTALSIEQQIKPDLNIA